MQEGKGAQGGTQATTAIPCRGSHLSPSGTAFRVLLGTQPPALGPPGIRRLRRLEGAARDVTLSPRVAGGLGGGIIISMPHLSYYCGCVSSCWGNVTFTLRGGLCTGCTGQLKSYMLLFGKETCLTWHICVASSSQFCTEK